MLDIQTLINTAKCKADECGCTTTITITITPDAPVSYTRHEEWVDGASKVPPLKVPDLKATLATATYTTPPELIAPEPCPLEEAAVYTPDPLQVVGTTQEAPSVPELPTTAPKPEVVAHIPAPNKGGLGFSLDDMVLPSLNLSAPAPKRAAPKQAAPLVGNLPIVTLDKAQPPVIQEGDTIELSGVFPGFTIEVVEIEDTILVVAPSHEYSAWADDEQACAGIAQALASEEWGNWEVLLA
jgi:hypothetical protein